MEQVGNLQEKFDSFSEHWRPKVIAALNGQELKLVKVQGEFPWHHHEACEELFMVWKGRFRVEFRDHIVDMGQVTFCVVPRGIEHRTAADSEAEVLIFEPIDVLNTGNVIVENFTAPQGVRI